MGQNWAVFFFFLALEAFARQCSTSLYEMKRPAALASTAARLPLLSYSFQAPHHAYENYSTEKEEGVLCEGELFLGMSSPSRWPSFLPRGNKRHQGNTWWGSWGWHDVQLQCNVNKISHFSAGWHGNTACNMLMVCSARIHCDILPHYQCWGWMLHNIAFEKKKLIKSLLSPCLMPGISWTRTKALCFLFLAWNWAIAFLVGYDKERHHQSGYVGCWITLCPLRLVAPHRLLNRCNFLTNRVEHDSQ